MLNIRVGGILIPIILSLCWGMAYATNDNPATKITAPSLNFKNDLGNLYYLSQHFDTLDGIKYTSKVLTEARFGEGSSKMSESFKTLKESLKILIDTLISDETKRELLAMTVQLPDNEDQAIETITWHLRSAYNYVFELSRKIASDWLMFKENPVNRGLILDHLKKKCGLKDTELKNSKLSELKPVLGQAEQALKTLVDMFNYYVEPKAGGASGHAGASTDAVPSNERGDGAGTKSSEPNKDPKVPASGTSNDGSGQNGAEQSTPTKDSATTPFISSLSIIALIYLSLL